MLAFLRQLTPRERSTATTAILELTTRQVEVLRLTVDGEPTKEIADQLGLSVGTVDLELRAIMAAIGVETRTRLVRVVIEAATLNQHIEDKLLLS